MTMIDADTYTAPNGTRVRMLGKNILVRMDPPPEMTRGGIVIPDTGHADIFATGEVVAVGRIPTVTRDADNNITSWGLIPIPGVSVGDRVLYIKFLADQDSNKGVRAIMGDDLIKMQASDILFAFDEEDRERLQP